MLGHGKSKEPQQKKSVIKQLQLEQDSGKSLHDDTISAYVSVLQNVFCITSSAQMSIPILGAL